MKLLIIISFLFFYNIQAQVTCEQMMNDAKKAVSQGNYRSAILKFQAAQKCNPDKTQEIDESILETFVKIERLKMQAERNIQTLGTLLGDITDLMQRDENASIIGMASLEKEILQLILPQYEFIKESAGSSNYDWEVARIYFRNALSKEKMGEGDYMADFQRAYEHSVSAIADFESRKRAIPEILIETMLESAMFYSWHLMNRERNEEAEGVLKKTYEMAKYYDERSANIYKGLAGIENAMARLSSNQNMQRKNLGHSIKAIDYITKAIELDSSNMVYKRSLSVYNKNIALLPDSILPAKEKTRYKTLGCAMADTIYKTPGSGNLTLLNVAACRYDRSYELTQKKKYNEAIDVLSNTNDELARFLHLDPRNTECSLLRALIVSRMGEIARLQGEREQQLDYLVQAKNDWVRIFAKGSLLPLDLRRLKTVYDRIIRALDLFPDTAKKITFLEDITTAFRSSAEDYGEVTLIAHIAADSYARMGELLGEQGTDYHKAQEYFNLAQKYFENTDLLADTSLFNVKYEWYCKAIYRQLSLNCEYDKIDLALDGLHRMEALFIPILEKYPYDYYLRQYFWLAKSKIGDWYFRQGRFAEARPYIEYASDWGVRESTQQLATLYRMGEYGKIDSKAIDSLDELSTKQLKISFTIPCDNDGNLSLHEIYARNYPAEFKYRGIDDHTERLQVAYGIITPDEVKNSFRKIYDLAIEHDVSFPELCGHFIADGKSKDNQAFDKIAHQDSISIEEKMEDYNSYVVKHENKVYTSSTVTVKQQYLERINKIIPFYKMFGQNEKALALAQRRVQLDSSVAQYFKDIANIQLNQYEESLTNGTKVDKSLFLTSDHVGALGEYYRYFLRKRDNENILFFQQKILKQYNYAYIRYIMFEIRNEYAVDLFSELYLQGDLEELEKDITYFRNKIREKLANGYRVSRYEPLIRLDERLLTLKRDSAIVAAVAQDYNSLAWYQLLTGRFKEAEDTLERGIDINKDNPYFYTNVPPVLLFQGQFEKAKKLYAEYKDKPFVPEAGFPKYKDAFLADFNTFKKEQIIPKEYESNVETIILMLEGKDI